jgi:hypothetical protein
MTSCPHQPAGLETWEKGGPNGAVLAVTHGEAKDLTAPVSAHAGGDHDSLVDHPPVHAGLAVGGVQEHIRERQPGQERSANERTSPSSSWQMRETSLLLMPESAPSARTRSSTLRVKTPSS